MKLRLFAFALALFTLPSLAQGPVGTAFTYQGSLHHQDAPAEGYFDFAFYLFDESEAGVLVAGPVEVSDVLVQGGVFAVELDFGLSVFGENQLWLELAVHEGGSPDPYTTLSPRQALTATPYALRALSIEPGAVTLKDLAPQCDPGSVLVMGAEDWRCCITPVPELCDGADNDCDDEVDEDFDALGTDCGVGACAGGTTVCSPDALTTACSTDDLAEEELCDGVDNDCDGALDELDPAPCPLTAGVCSGAGNGVTCTAGQWIDQCDYGANFEQGEVSCDGLDNDCDGQTDEETVFCPEVTNGLGVCLQGTCGVECVGSFLDCDGLSVSGCEIDGSTDANHCGGCGHACEARTNATVFCEQGGCQFTCDPGFNDCNGEAVDGCENAGPC